MNEYLLVCKLLKPIGLKGEIKVFTYTTFKETRYKKGSKLYYKKDNEYVELVVRSHYSKGGSLDVLGFENYLDANSIAPLSGLELFALKDENLLKKNEFYYSDLTSLKVIDEDNNEIGTVYSIQEFPAQITLEIAKKGAKHHYFIPFNDFFIKEVSLENKYIKVHLIEGLID